MGEIKHFISKTVAETSFWVMTRRIQFNIFLCNTEAIKIS
jgi:hypothetical protein